MKPRLQVHYEERVRTRLQDEFGFDNPHRVPRLEKIVVNVGLGEAPKNPNCSKRWSTSSAPSRASARW